MKIYYKLFSIRNYRNYGFVPKSKKTIILKIFCVPRAHIIFFKKVFF